MDLLLRVLVAGFLHLIRINTDSFNSGFRKHMRDVKVLY